jgi:hypothetical protein
MNTASTITTNQAAILGRSILPLQPDMPVDVARFLVHIHFSAADTERMNELAAKARAGTLSPNERQDLDDYCQVGNLLETIKSRARRALKKGGSSR